MPSEWNNLAPHMNRDVERVFAERVLYMPVNGQPVWVKGHFDEAFEVIEVDADVPVSATHPTLEVVLSSLPIVPKQDDLVQVGIAPLGKLYKVYEVNVDGNGGALLMLVEQDQEAV